MGSLGASGSIDRWSDVDIAAVVHDNALGKWFPNVGWLEATGQVWARSQSETDLRKTTRIVFDDGRRLDVIFFGHTLGRPDLDGRRVWRTDRLLASTPIVMPDSPRTPVEELTNKFRFVSTLALVELARGDELIGVHLALECVRICLVLGMLMRDADTPDTMWADLPRTVGELVAASGNVCAHHQLT